jgi:hypothetical protein
MLSHRRRLRPLSRPSDGHIARNLVSVPEAARRAKMTPRTIWGLIRAGLIPAWGTPKCYRVSMDYLLPRVKPTVGRLRKETMPPPLG